MPTILSTMLQRLYAGILRGPSLNARPGRQRVDWMDFAHFAGVDPAPALKTLLGEARAVEFPAKVKPFGAPKAPEDEWTPDQKQARDAAKRQIALLQRLRDIAEDARDFQNDHGESALFLGFPLLWLPRADSLKQSAAGREARVLAPLAFVPVSLGVRRGGRPGATVRCLAEGADLLVPNPALGAWIEQQTGRSIDELFGDHEGAEPWRELAEIVEFVRKSLDLPAEAVGDFGEETPLVALKDAKELPTQPALIASAVLGLFPLANLGLLRDTRWMLENEAALSGPVCTFLKPAALEPAPEVPEATAETLPAYSQAARDFVSETLVTDADPCQGAAVRHARASDALVIHGPPGTGKSQTTANIIGDHLGRGERVLFVCDKRTAIDVVKYRLDALGLGSLCGVVHDPARDRTALYKQLREHLENLADAGTEPDRSSELASVNRRLSELHQELTAAYTALNAAGAESASFHELAGEWLELTAAAPAQEGEPALPLVRAEVEQHQAGLDEVWRRAVRIGWGESPWRGAIGIPLADFLERKPAEWDQTLDGLAVLANAADEFADEQLLPLDAAAPAHDQATARREVAANLEELAERALPPFCARVATLSAEELAALQQERAGFDAAHAETATPLDPELRASVQDAVPAVAELNARLQAIEAFRPIAQSWKRFIAFGPKAAATKALAPLGLPLSREHLEKARGFYRGLRARVMLARFVQECAAEGAPKPLLDDARLRGDWQKIDRALAAAQACLRPELASVQTEVRAALTDLGRAPALAANLRMSADRAERLAQLEEAVSASGLFESGYARELFARWRANTRCSERAQAWSRARGTLEDAVRLTAALQRLPQGLAAHAVWHAEHGTEADLAFRAMQRAACEQELRARTKADRALQAIDTERVEAAFRTLEALGVQKQQLVRGLAVRQWRLKQRARLLASTGSRLSPVGTALKQRLIMRGERALKLRQMIATGAETPGGDPLFDLCPVWMTSPATVAQVFPRTPFFDAVVFDEASQCRLEEALPVLLRARRVVVAGDPKQLPPTRFFEGGVADSGEIDAETAEELFEQQQSEVEDLLGAALNLNVQEAFLDVHYRSRDEALIGFSNEQFYGTRLQPIPGHPKNKALSAALKVHRVDGTYESRSNRAEAEKVVELVAELLGEAEPPSIGIACFNLPQRDLIIDLLDERAEQTPDFATRLAAARERRGRGSFEGLFVKNLENVQGDERDVMIICTTFAPDAKGKFRRNFGALSGGGGGRRLNVLVTRAREGIHLITSIPRSEYAALPPVEPGRIPNGRFFLYAYLRYAESLASDFEQWQEQLERLQAQPEPQCSVRPVAAPSRVAEGLGHALRNRQRLGSVVHWGNDGFCVDAAIVHPELPADVTVGVLTDFNRFTKTPDPVEWELFRTRVLQAQGWALHRVWTPALLRDWERELEHIRAAHEREIARSRLVEIEK